VILGDSVHLERHSLSFIAYARAHAEELSALPTGLFQVCLYAASHDAGRQAKVHGYIEDVVEKTGWEPDIVGVFAGALAYTQYGWVKRHRMHVIAKREGEVTDIDRDYDFTDWDAVDHFADDALAVIRAHRGHTLG
jgi:menaquinone-dependent protoporphyrinogen oxidase